MHDSCYYGAPLVRADAVDPAIETLLTWFSSSSASASFFRLNAMATDSVTAVKLVAACERERRRVQFMRQSARPVLNKTCNVEALLQTRISSRRRADWRRVRRRLDALGNFEIKLLPISEVLVDQFLTMEAAGWKATARDGGAMRNKEYRAVFFKDVVMRGSKRSQMQCIGAVLNGRPIAMAFQMRSRGQMFGFKTAYDEHYSAYSPGVLMFIDLLRRISADPSIERFDPCVRPDHPVFAKILEARVEMAEVNIAGTFRDGFALKVLGEARGMHERLTGVGLRMVSGNKLNT